MTNTIEVLETIGKNASLRHASGPNLDRMLEEMHASHELRRAASTGEAHYLHMELGQKDMEVNHNPPPPNGGCGEWDVEEAEEEGKDRKPSPNNTDKNEK